MQHELLVAYLDHIEKIVLGCDTAYVERYTEEILTPGRVNLRIRIRFNQGNLLEINEAVVIDNDSLTYLDYRYHCQNEQNQLIFRYDSTPHFPELPSFPHHKHLSDRVIACDKPMIEQVLQEALVD